MTMNNVVNVPIVNAKGFHEKYNESDVISSISLTIIKKNFEKTKPNKIPKMIEVSPIINISNSTNLFNCFFSIPS